MNSVLYGLDDNNLSADEIKLKMVERLDLLTNSVRDEMESDVIDILDCITDDTFVTTPLYKIMGMLPDVYLLDANEQTVLLIKIGKTVENLMLLNEVI
jgi:hypothetical protein